MRPMDDADRAYFDARFCEIAERMNELGLIRGNAWRVETANGRVFQFRCVRSYARRGTEADRQEREQTEGTPNAK